jgi:ribonuclease-3
MTAEKTPPKDAKTSLQEWAQGKGFDLPDYRTVDRSGPDHAPHFTIEVRVGKLPPERGEGASKRTAEQVAAERLLERLGVADD